VSAPERERVAALEAARVAAVRQLNDDVIAHRNAADERRSRMAAAERQLRGESSDATTAAAQETVNRLADELAALEHDVEERRAAKAAVLADGTGAVGAGNPTAQLSGMLGALFGEWRTGADRRMDHLLREHVRHALHDAALRAERVGVDNREARSAALAEHKEAREAGFDAFRRSRRETRRHAADAFYAALKIKRERHCEEGAKQSGEVRLRHERHVEEAMAGARADTTAAVERMVAQRQAALRDEAGSAEQRLRQAEQAHAAELKHHRALHRADTDSLRHRAELEHEAIRDRGVADRAASDTDVAALRGRVSHLHEAASMAAHGVGNARRLPVASVCDEKEAAVATLRTQLASRSDALQRDWERLRGLLLQLDAGVGKLGESASGDRAAVVSAQTQLDAVRTAWERDERAALTKPSLPSADSTTCNVTSDVAAALRGALERCGALRQARAANHSQTISLEEGLEEQHARVTRTTMAMMAKYDELAASVAAVEAKQRHLDAEEGDQRLAATALNSEWDDFAAAAQRMQARSASLQNEAAYHKENRHGAPRYGGGGGGGGKPAYASATSPRDFSALVALSSDASVPPTTASGSGGGQQSLTTPSPDTEGSMNQ
jgi:hypothetical protein